MKYSIFPFFLAILFTLPYSTRADKIKFRELSFAEAQATAQKEGKPIFMDAYTVWCGPCKWMSANIFTDPEVAAFYNKNFVNIKVDMEKGEGPELAKKYGVRGYPTLLWLNAEGEVLLKAMGAAQETKPYIEKGQRALNPKGNLLYLNAHKEKNFEKPAFMRQYFEVKKSASELDDEEVERYFEQFAVAKWAEEDLWKTLQNTVENAENKSFKKALKNREVLEKKRGKEEVDEFFTKVYYYSLGNARYRARNDEQRMAWLKKVDEDLRGFSGKEEVLFYLNLLDARLQKNWEAYARTAQSGVEKYYWEQANELNDIAWNVYENVEDPALLSDALLWAKRAVDLDGRHHILDTYAHLLFATGKSEKALSVELKALELAQEKNADTGDYHKLINQIRQQ